MEVITIESQAYKELVAKINTIAKFVSRVHNNIFFVIQSEAPALVKVRGFFLIING